MKKKPATTTTSATGTKIRTMLITVSTRSLVLSTLIIVLSVNTSSTFQYDWWNKLTNASSQEASSGIHGKAWLPADKTVRDKFWSTAWTPMISVTSEADVRPEDDKSKQKEPFSSSSTTPAPAEVRAAEAAAVTSFHPALFSISEKASSSPSTPPAQSPDITSISAGKSESLEWQPSLVSDRKDHDEHNDADKEEDFNAFAARNTRSYVPLAKIRSKSAEAANIPDRNSDSLMKQSGLSASSSSRTQKVSWDDHLEFPGSTLLPQKLVGEVRATTTSIWADQGTSPATDSITSSTNSRKWSSRTGPQRITNRFGSIKQGKQQKAAVKSASLVDDFKQSQNLEKSYEDAVSDIQSKSQQQQQSSSENEGSAGDVSGESERLSFAGKTSNRNQNKERLAVKGRLQSQEKKSSGRQQKRQKVALQIQISPAAVEQESPQQQQQWSNAKVSQYFRWENPETSSERLVEEDDDTDDQSVPKLRNQAETSARQQGDAQVTPEQTTSAPRAITKTNINRSGALKGVTKGFARQRKPSITTTTLAPDYETETEAVTERSVTTTRQPRLEASYEQASRQAVKSPQKKTRNSNTVRLAISAKSQSIVQSSGRGYEWSSDIDHNDERPAEIKSTTTAFGGEDRPLATSSRFTNPTTTSIAVTTTPTTRRTTTTTSTTTARPTPLRLQTKGKQTSQRQTSVSVVKSSFEQNSDTSISSTDSTEDDDAVMDEAKAKFQKKSGVQYSSSVEKEDDVTVERDFSKKSGEQGSGNPDDPENCRLEDSIPGIPLTDYPTYSEIPKTNFKCSDQTLPGYYGDVEAQCQVFHVCQQDGRKNDFLCPVGTVFNQEIFVCDWWQNFRCQDTPNFYRNNDELYKTPVRTTEIASNQLRKRTDTIEREEDAEPPFSDEVRDDSGSSLPDDSSNSSNSDAEAEDEVSSTTSRPASVSRSQLAVKGYNEKQVVTEEPKVVTSGRIEVYGARMSRKQRQQRGEKLAAAAASKSRSSIPPNGNLTEVVRNVTAKMSTSALPLPVN